MVFFMDTASLYFYANNFYLSTPGCYESDCRTVPLNQEITTLQHSIVADVVLVHPFQVE